MQKTLFLCSRMEPFGVADLRSNLMSQFGYQSSADQRIFRLHSEDRALRPNEDARMFCARAIQASDGVVLILDGSASSARSGSDAPVLELEVMLAAACSKPVLVLDGSGGDDPLHQLLGTEFFSSPTGTRTNVLSLRGINPAGKLRTSRKFSRKLVKDTVRELQRCPRMSGGKSCSSLDQIGWMLLKKMVAIFRLRSAA